MAAGQGSEPAARLDHVLASLAEAIRVISVLLLPFMPTSARKLLDALGAPDLSLADATFAPRGGGTVGERA